VNLYGPSESTLAKIFNRFKDKIFEVNQIVPLGKPISNTSILILNNISLCEIGEIGEIHIKTPFLTLGYYGNELLNSQSFIQNPLNQDNIDIIYKTGDLGKYLPDRSIEFLGRADRQVKINGNRVEPGEIEFVLNSFPEIDQSVILPNKNSNHESRLLAYYTSKQKISVNEIRSRLLQFLPEYMIPSFFIELEQFPLNFNGKINKKELPKPDELLYENVEYKAPENNIEIELSKIWSEALGIKKVGIKNKYLEFGGNSLTAIKLISKIFNKFNLEISIRELFEDGSIESISKLVEKSKKTAVQEITKAKVKAKYPLSHQQRRIWITSQFDKSSIAYNIPSAYYLFGTIDYSKFEIAVNKIIERHEILRTAFTEENGIPYQVIEDKIHYKISKNEFKNSDSSIEDIIKHQFDLTTPPLLRFDFFEVSKDKTLFIFNIHHLITDGWSLRIMVNELNEIYNSLIREDSPQLNEIRFQYRDYSEWQLTNLSDNRFDKQRVFWLDKLSGDLPILTMPTDIKRTKERTFRGAVSSFTLTNDTLEKINFLTSKFNITNFTLILSLLKILLFRYTNQNDIILGTVIAGRNQSELHNLQGFFSNTIVIRDYIDGKKTFSELIPSINKNILTCFDNQEYPFELILNDLNLPRDTFHQPLFDIMYIYRNDIKDKLKIDGIRSEEFKLNESISRFDLSFEFIEDNGNYLIEVNYNIDLFEEKTIEKLIKHFDNLVYSVYTNPYKNILSLDILNDTEIKELINLNYKTSDFNINQSIAEQFDEIVKMFPKRTAIVHRENSASYSELNSNSNSIASYLYNNCKIKKGDIVAVICDKGIHLVECMIGIFKLGAIYFPIDPYLPSSRIDYLIQSSNCSAILSSSQYMQNFSYDYIDLKNINDNDNYKTSSSNSDDGAYLIYTSGTTGNPKGVIISHKGFLNQIQQQILLFGLNEHDRVLQFASQSFDGSITETFWALLSGATSVIADRTTINDVFDFTEYIQRNCVTKAYLPPSYLNILDKTSINTLDAILSAGESPILNDVKKLLHSKNIYNLYGPTEASCTVSLCEITENDISNASIPIGKPIANMNIYILNEELKFMPIGSSGEICISGVGVAKGYLHSNGNAKSFLKDPYQSGMNLYRTGDIGRMRKDGNIEFLGRLDEQVKVNGIRIELEEIRHRLNYCYGVKDSCVVSYKNSVDRNNIAAYVILNDNSNQSDVISYVKKQLPQYMTPAKYIFIDKFPVSFNGKIDRNRLPDPNGVEETKASKLIPKNSLETSITDFIKDILKIDSVYLDDDFFRIGGHSLSAIQLLSKINKEYHCGLTLNDIFQNSIIKDLCNLVSKTDNHILQSIPKIEGLEYYPLSHSQKGIWIISNMENGALAFSSPSVYQFIGNFEYTKFENAINALISKHETLRTSFHIIDGELKQYIHKTIKFDLAILNLPSENYFEIMDREIELEINKPFDLSKAPLIRIKLFIIAEDKHYCLFNMHHIIADGWSVELLLKELNSYYNNSADYINNHLRNLPIQFKDFALWHNQQIDSGSFDKQKNYWLRKLSSKHEVLDLPVKKTRPQQKTFAGKKISFIFKQDIKKDIKLFTDKNNVSMFVFVVSILKLIFYRYTNQKDIILGTAVAGRTNYLLENIIGPFSNILVLRDELTTHCSFSDLLFKVNQTIGEGLENQDYPFEILMEDLKVKTDNNRNSIFDIAVVYQYNNFEKLMFNELTIIPYNIQSGISKYDILFSFYEDNESIHLDIDYNPDIYEDTFISMIPLHFENLTKQIINNSNIILDEYEIITENELKEIEQLNDTTSYYPKDTTIDGLFDKIADNYLSNTSIINNNSSINYYRLKIFSDSIAQYLIDIGISKGDVVAIVIDRNEYFIACMLGIIKSGAVYLPIDKETPVERIEYILNDSRTRLLIYDDDILISKIKISNILKISDIPLTLSLEHRKLHCSKDIAYIIYTSGTTGSPRGIMVNHKNLINTILHQIDEFEINNDSVILQMYSSAFDASMLEIFISLFSGATLLIADKNLLNNTSEFLDYLNHNKASFAFFPPSYLALLDKKRLVNLRTIVTGMEAPILSDAINLSKELNYYNIYGPTETTVICSFHKVFPEFKYSKTIPIGKPMRNYGIYIMSDSLKIQPKNIIGEICIEGDGVTEGYLRDIELTESKFKINSYTGNKIFCSGDLGRLLNDGNIEFISRKDNQAKIRGYRIELNDIKIALDSINSIQDSYIMISNNGNKEIIAYFVSNSVEDISQIRYQLSQKIPSYMIPHQFIKLDKIPLTINGKVDKDALPNPSDVNITSSVMNPPVNELETKLLDVWSKILNKKEIGTNSNFFELGGDSIKAIQLVSRAKQYGINIEVKDIFKYLNIENISKHIKSNGRFINQDMVKGIFPLNAIQDWFFEHHYNVSYHFNQAFLLNSKINIDYNLMVDTLNYVALHHDTLRTIFKNENGIVVQEICGHELKPEIQLVNINDNNEMELLINHLQSSMDIEKGPLLKSALLKSPDGDKLFIVIHHLIIDGISWRILLEDIITVYNSLKESSTVALPLKTNSFGEWCESLDKYLKSDEMEMALQYWINKNFKHSNLISYDMESPNNTFAYNEICSFSLNSDETTDLLENINRTFNTEINDILITAVVKTFCTIYNLSSINILIESHGREKVFDNLDISRTIGWFTSFYPVSFDFNNNSDIEELLSKTKSLLKEVPNKGFDYPLIRQFLDKDKKRFDSTPQICFNYLGQFSNELDNEVFDGADEFSTSSVASETDRIHDFIINCIVQNGCFELYLSYNKERFFKSSIDIIMSGIKESLLEIVTCSKKMVNNSNADWNSDSHEISIDSIENFLEDL
jgi:amino acid adenylation domain-containing protein/non-ribosomal peptide synthase protein (TIGR01720 family)